MPRTLPDGFVRLYSNNNSLLLRLPKRLAVLLPKDQIYRLEADDVGIHLFPVDAIEMAQLVLAPSWARKTPESQPEPSSAESSA